MNFLEIISNILSHLEIWQIIPSVIGLLTAIFLVGRFVYRLFTQKLNVKIERKEWKRYTDNIAVELINVRWELIY